MAADFDRHGYGPEQSFQGYTPNTDNRQQKNRTMLTRLAVVGIVVLAIGLTGWSLISAANEKQDKGTLSLQTSDQSAQITLIQPDGSSVAVGKGNTQTRVNAGTYMVEAAAGGKRSLTTVLITTGATTDVNLQLQENSGLQTVADFHTADIFPANQNIYFLNPATKVPNVLALGESAGRPVYTNAYGSKRLQWVTPNSAFVLTAQNDWKYVSNNQLRDLNIVYELMVGPANSNLMAFSAKGSYAYIDSTNTVWFASNPTAAPVKIGTADKDFYKLTVGSDDSVTAYPTVNSSAANRKTIRIRNGQSSEIKPSSSGISFMVWSPDNTKAAYVSDDGLYVYDPSKSDPDRVITVSPQDKQAIVWTDSSNLVFAFRNALWRYNTESKNIDSLADYNGSLNTSNPLTLAGDFVYFSTTKDSGGKGGGTYRVALTSKAGQQTIPSNALSTSYSGFDKLTDHGVSSDQLANTRYAVSKYIGSLDSAPKSVGISSIATLPMTPGKPQALKLNLNIDSTVRAARLEYDGLTATRLYVYDSKNNVVFDSGNIDN